MNILKTESRELPELGDVPRDYKYKTTLLNKGKLAGKASVWLELTVDRGAVHEIYHAVIPNNLTIEQKEYLAAAFRKQVGESTDTVK